MKIVLVSYSQDVNILHPEDSATFIVIGDEETGHVTRVPVPTETVMAITEFVEALKESTIPLPDQEPEEEEQPPEQQLEDEPEEEEAPPPPPPAPRKTMPVPRPSIRQRLAGPPSEDGIPSL